MYIYYEGLLVVKKKKFGECIDRIIKYIEVFLFIFEIL